MYSDVEETTKETSMAQLIIISRHSLGTTEENHKTSVKITGTRTEFRSWQLRIQGRIFTAIQSSLVSRLNPSGI